MITAGSRLARRLQRKDLLGSAQKTKECLSAASLVKHDASTSPQRRSRPSGRADDLRESDDLHLEDRHILGPPCLSTTSCRGDALHGLEGASGRDHMYRSFRFSIHSSSSEHSETQLAPDSWQPADLPLNQGLAKESHVFATSRSTFSHWAADSWQHRDILSDLFPDSAAGRGTQALLGSRTFHFSSLVTLSPSHSESMEDVASLKLPQQQQRTLQATDIGQPCHDSHPQVN